MSAADGRAALFAPAAVAGLTLRNRFVMSPMNRNAAPGGVPGEDIARFYRRRADGEAGLIFTGGIGIDHPAAVGVSGDRPCNVPTFEGAARDGWRRVVDLVHAGGGTIVAQLWHQGPMRAEGTGYTPDAPSFRPSGIWGPATSRTQVKPDWVARFAQPTASPTDDDIRAVVDAYARSARTAVELGFDAIDLHGANGYLIDAFLWAETNRRTDRWGGSPRARTRFAAEVVQAVRRAVGAQRPIFFRFSQWKHQDLDARLADTPAALDEILGPIADAGVDVFAAATFDFDEPAFAGSDLSLAGWAKKLTGRPSVTSGSVGLSRGLYGATRDEPHAVDNLDALARRFERGEFDLVAVGRSLLQDPAWVRKARLGLPFETYSDAALRALN